MYVDVHTHLTHSQFSHDLDQVVARASQANVMMVVNGLEPISNRRILEMSQNSKNILAALGIYPIDAINHLVGELDLPFPVAKFSVADEITFIRQQAASGNIAAIGECGLDAHWVSQSTYKDQEQVFESLMEIADEFKLPLIIHTRKLEKRAIEILAHHRAEKVNFHCFCGKTKLAIQAAEHYDWYFSIPANARKSQSFTKLLKELPSERILTETDAPYLGPERGIRNEPINVIGTVEYLAELRQWPQKQAQEQIWSNFQRLFNC